MTGSSRGIGAETAKKLALRGSDVVLNYRDKRPRAEQVAAEIGDLGRKAFLARADLTLGSELASMFEAIKSEFGKLDVLVLNASGGLEKNKAPDYASLLNETAQIDTARHAVALMQHGGRIVFVTSHWAHFYGRKPVLPEYEAVARSKHAGEQALRHYAENLWERGISFAVVSGDAIEGTITPRLLERSNPDFARALKASEDKLPTVEEFAEAISEAAADPSLPNGHTIFVGSIDR